jgi:hypothetical protein
MLSLIWLAGLGISLVGAYFIANLSFRKAWKSGVTQPKLIGFLSTFVLSFVAIFYAIGYIISQNIPFGR